MDDEKYGDGDLDIPDVEDDDIDDTGNIILGKKNNNINRNDDDDDDEDENTQDLSENESEDLESDNNSELNEDDIETTDISQQPRNMLQQNAFLNISDDDDDDDENDDLDENYLQKFDESIQNKIIEDFHPELKSHNYEEIEILSRIVRDENGNIIDPLHKTLPFLTRYEKARIIGERSKQLNSGAISTIEVDPNIIDGYLIALKEFEEKKIPFIVKRPLPNGGCEYWRFADLEIIN